MTKIVLVLAGLSLALPAARADDPKIPPALLLKLSDDDMRQIREIVRAEVKLAVADALRDRGEPLHMPSKAPAVACTASGCPTAPVTYQTVQTCQVSESHESGCGESGCGRRGLFHRRGRR